MNLTAKGWSSRKIAAHLKISHTEVLRRLHDILEELRAATIDRAAIVRERQLEDIESIREKLIPLLSETVLITEQKIVSGKAVTVPLPAWEKSRQIALTLMKIFEREARLVGADAPARLEAVEASPKLTPEEIIERQRSARERALSIAMGKAVGGEIAE